METYQVKLIGTQPLLMHADDIEWADQMQKWRNDKDNKKTGVAGDDRTPAYRWIGYLYRDENGDVVMPTDNIMRALMEGGAMVPVPGARGNKTFKAQSQSGIMPRDTGWLLLVNGKKLDGKSLSALLEERDFEVHKIQAEKLGFDLFVKRVKIGASKHVRVRPRFYNWSAQGELVVSDEQITADILADLLETAGKYKGLGDWRPSSKTPGTYGMFRAEIKRV